MLSNEFKDILIFLAIKNFIVIDRWSYPQINFCSKVVAGFPSTD
jgi:hypothetical protein